MTKKNTMQEINSIANQLPLEVLEDINKRITDWLAFGGSEEHPYIEQQLRFAKRFINYTEGECNDITK